MRSVHAVGLCLSLCLLLALGLTACGPIVQHALPLDVDIGQDAFDMRSQVSGVLAPTPFRNKASVGYTVCVGHDGQCDAKAQGPKDIVAPGFSIGPGATHLVTFDQHGTYAITCTGHPQMNMTRSVR
jgi:plastocyanin